MRKSNAVSMLLVGPVEKGKASDRKKDSVVEVRLCCDGPSCKRSKTGCCTLGDISMSGVQGYVKRLSVWTHRYGVLGCVTRAYDALFPGDVSICEDCGVVCINVSAQEVNSTRTVLLRSVQPLEK